MPHRRRFLPAALMAAWLALPAVAQPEALTLAQALRLARSQSFAVQANRERINGLQAQQRAVEAGLYPQVGLRGGASYLHQLGGIAPGLAGGAGTATPLIPGLGVDTTLSATQLLFDGGGIAANAAAASDQAAIGALTLRQAELEAMSLAANGYYQVLRAETLQTVASDAVSQAQEHLRLGNLRLRAGAGTRAEVLDLKAKLANTRVNWLQASNASLLARLTLANAINDPVGDRRLIPAPAPSAHRARPEAMIDLAYGQRPEVAIQASRMASAHHRAEAERAAIWPVVAAAGRVSQRNLQQGGAFAGVDLSWPVYDADRIGSRIRAAVADAAAEKAQLSLIRQTVALDVQQAYLIRDEAVARLMTTKEGLAAAEEAYRITVRRFELGLATPVELTDAHNTLLQARQNVVQTTYDQALAEIRLARAAGEDLDVYFASDR